MNLISQILEEMGADISKSFTVCMGECAYFKGIKGVILFSPQKITLSGGKNYLSVTGENLTIARYFQGDIVIKGNICGVQIEKSL